MITSDFHMHTNFSTDADRDVFPEVQIQAAIEKGLKQICITDHYDKDYQAEETDPEGKEEPFVLEFDQYFRELTELREKYREFIDIGIGIEFGLQPFLGAFYRELAQKWPFDFIIGSTHVFQGRDPYYGGGSMTDPEMYRACFEEMLEDVKNNDAFDVLGHIDYVVRYGKEQAKHYSYRENAEVLDEILKTIIEKGKGIELNMAGLKYGLDFAHPHPDILKRYKELGGEIITVGSDGHKPQHLAYEFEKAGGILEAAGFKYYTVFQNRKPQFLKIS